jgi:hypothetical protein
MAEEESSNTFAATSSAAGFIAQNFPTITFVWVKSAFWSGVSVR